MSVGGVCTPQQCAAVGAKTPVVKPQAIVNPQAIQSAPASVLAKPAGSMDMRV